MSEKKPLPGLFRDNPATPEGKYLVKRRDGTVLTKPHFVLVSTDPVAEVALRAYATEVDRLLREEPEKAASLGFVPGFSDSVRAWAERWVNFRDQHGNSDPGMGPHRKDDPATIEEMRKGMSA